jgi:hypothetical protein
MTDDERTCLGQMSPAAVVKCAEDSNTECWIAAEVCCDDGSTKAYECCGGAGKKARFLLRRGFMEPRSLAPGDVPDGLTWYRRSM